MQRFVIFNLRIQDSITTKTNLVSDTLESGTCATIWPLHGATLDDSNLSDLHHSFNIALPLSITDILHTQEESQMFQKCTIHCIMCIIVNHGGEGFEKFQLDLNKCLPKTNQQIPMHKTKLYPFPTWKIDESTIVGNADVNAAIVRELHLQNQSTMWMRRGLYSAPLIPAGIQSFLQNPVDSCENIVMSGPLCVT